LVDYSYISHCWLFVREKGTLPTHTPLFIFFVAMVVVVIGALVFFPANALGPIVEHLTLMAS
jgi:K+-transporting ATPase ATPase A chain